MYRFVLTCWILVSLSFGQDCPHEQGNLRDWSDKTGWPNDELPSADEDVTISDPVLLDISTPKLKRINITSTGKLIFSPDVGELHLQAKNILVQGEMHIGAEKCRFTGKAKITLLGKREANSENVPGFGQKFIGVSSGGLLEVHGKEKLSWTKLSKTVNKGSADTIMKVEANRSFFSKSGYVISYMNPDDISNTLTTVTVRTDYANPSKADDEAVTAENTIKNIPNGFMVFIGVRHDAEAEDRFEEFYDEVEKLGWGSITDNSKLRSLKSGESYVFYTLKGDTSETIERNSAAIQGQDITETEEIIDDKDGRGWKIDLVSSINSQQNGKSFVLFRITDYDIAYPVIDVIEDISSWNAGDTIVIASTDYDFRQTETAEIKSIENSNRFRITSGLEFSHFGKIVNRVDMRAEVGMLTRNVLIEGEIQDDCPSENENCDEFPFDTWGGHLKAVNGFKSFRFQGTELHYMGQQPVLGSYPLHYHLCGDLGGYEIPQYWKGNSIHESFSRCTTVHGTQNATVNDNVCYDFLGHGFFMEDGCESGVTFDGNLGVVARDGSLLSATDKTPATFWITSPKATITNNVAAGGQAYGFWLIYPVAPTGPSADNDDCIPDGQAQYTPFTKFENNVAHSHNMDGLIVDKQLDENLEVIGTNSYKPVSDPSNPNSEDVEVILSRITSYKNKRRNVVIRGGQITVEFASLSDSPVGIAMIRQDSTEQEQSFKNSVIMGESSNTGTGDFTWESTVGVLLTNGPFYVSNVWFDGFKDGVNRSAAAMSWSEMRPSPILWVSDATFGFEDPSGGNRLQDSEPTGSIYDEMRTMYDVDGDITGAGVAATVVTDLDFHVTSSCMTRSSWPDLAICPYRYAQVRVMDVTHNNDGSTVPEFTRVHSSDESNQTFTSNFNSGDAPANFILGGQYLYILDWSKGVPQKFKIKPLGVDKDNWVIIGAQIGVGASFAICLANPKIGKKDWKSVDSITDLAATTTQGSYYYDSGNGILYFKLFTEDAREADDTDMCPGGDCPVVAVTVNPTKRELEKEEDIDEEEAVANQRQYLLKEILRVLENEKRSDPYKKAIQKMLHGKRGHSGRSNTDENRKILKNGQAEKKRGDPYKTTMLKRQQGIRGNRHFYIDEIKRTKIQEIRQKRSPATLPASPLNPTYGAGPTK